MTAATGIKAHVNVVAASCVALEMSLDDLSLVQDYRRQEHLMAAGVTTRPVWHRDEEQGNGYLSAFDMQPSDVRWHGSQAKLMASKPAWRSNAER